MFSFLNTSTTLILLYLVLLIVSLKYIWKYLRIYYLISKIPSGPKGWPIIGNILLVMDILNVETYFGLFRDYGDFVKSWLGPFPLFFVANPDILQSIYTNPNALHKGWVFRLTTSNVLKESLIRAHVEAWKQNRKICNYAFSPAILNSFLPIFNQVSTALVKQFKNKIDQTKPFDVYPYFRRSTLDSICATAMGIDVNSLQEVKSKYAKAFEGVVENTAVRFTTFWLYPNFIFNRTKWAKQQHKAMKIVWDTASKVIDEKLEWLRNNKDSKMIQNEYANLDQPIEKNPLKKPLLEFLIDLMQVYPDFTVEQLKQEVNLFIMAGFETSAITLSYALVVFGARKDIQEKAYHEMCNIFGNSERSVELDDLANMKYLELIIKETLRLYPAIAHITREATEDMIVGDYKIPAGTSFLISMIGTHHNPKYWENPKEFIPERFLTTNRHPYAWIPFSSGPRNCIGYKYAMMFMKIQLANILRKYEIHTDLKLDELKYEIDLSLRLADGYFVRLTER